jgi:hypothetical protein
MNIANMIKAISDKGYELDITTKLAFTAEHTAEYISQYILRNKADSTFDYLESDNYNAALAEAVSLLGIKDKQLTIF